VNDSGDPLRRLAQERGRLLGELGVRPADLRWQRLEADAIASLVVPVLRFRLPAPIGRFWLRLKRAAGGV
jgi:hypothetical protein